MEYHFNVPRNVNNSLLIYSGQYVSNEFLLEVNLVMSFMGKETLNRNAYYYFVFSNTHGIL